eukprot:scaffold142111_cov133-Phaeocystis_antarctica.AAC.1
MASKTTTYVPSRTACAQRLRRGRWRRTLRRCPRSTRWAGQASWGCTRREGFHALQTNLRSTAGRSKVSAARRGASQRHELVLYRRHQPARAHAVVPHHCPVFVGPTRPDFAASLGTNPQKGATVPPLLLGAIVKQESMAPPLCYLTHSSKSRTSSSKRTVPTKVGPRGVRPRDLFV